MNDTIQKAMDEAKAEYQALDQEARDLAARLDQVSAARLVAMGKVQALASLLKGADDVLDSP